MKKKIFIIAMLLFMLPFTVSASTEEDFEVISSETKYYKTTTIYKNNLLSVSSMMTPTSYTEEITEEEYNNAPIESECSPNIDTTIYTEYKTMISSIAQNGSYYRYQNQLIWKKNPKVRSYDIIAIGRYPSVKVVGTPSFTLKYCTSSANCTTSTTATKQNFSNGSGASFKLPTGDFVSLKATYYYDVEKNVDATILGQNAYADYSHATTTVTAAEAQKYQVSPGGITLDQSVYSKYDDINLAVATWSGSW